MSVMRCIHCQRPIDTDWDEMDGESCMDCAEEQERQNAAQAGAEDETV